MLETALREARIEDVSKKTEMYDKRTSLTEAVTHFLKDGISIGIGGLVTNRTPIASIHEIIRQGARELTLSVQSNSICCELLAGAMILKPHHLTLRKIELGWHGNEVTCKTPLLRYLTSKRTISLEYCTNYVPSACANAEATVDSDIPNIEHGDRDVEPIEHARTIICPFTGGNINLVPANRPDLALIHVQAADMYGNSRIFGDQCACYEIAQNSVNTIVTAEQIIPNSSILNHPLLTSIPSHIVDAIIDQPFGATPGACYGNYSCDLSEIDEFTNISEDFLKTGNMEKLRDYYDNHIFYVENFDDFLEQKPYPILQRLCQQDGGKPIILD